MSNRTKYIVWIKCRTSEEGYKLDRHEQKWEEQGDGPLTEKQALRISKELSQDFDVRVRIRPEEFGPPLHE